MTDVAIRCEGLAKQYRIGERESYKALRDVITEAFAAPFRRLFSRSGGSSNGNEKPMFWALKDVSFEIERGGVVGIIGRNGAGKSTLLKILSRITEPTEGRVVLRGRVASLLEVGTGFHGELTGRENIYLNGAILGMRAKDISRQFDRIVAFAEVEKFIDTPVKHYSTGMYMRLAFAVAAHLEPEILLVDEVLAVGDVGFQRKCLGRIGEVAADGRTVLFVSHNMGAIRSLCTKGIVLDKGRVTYFGQIAKSIETYFESTNNSSNHADVDGSLRHGFGPIWLTGSDGTIEQGDSFEINTTMRPPPEAAGFTVLCVLEDPSQRNIFHLRIDSSDLKLSLPWRENYSISVRLPALWLEPGLYSLWFKALYCGQAVQPRVLSDVYYLDVGGRSSGWNAVLSPTPQWCLEPVDAAHGCETEAATSR